MLQQTEQQTNNFSPDAWFGLFFFSSFFKGDTVLLFELVRDLEQLAAIGSLLLNMQLWFSIVIILNKK